MVEKMVWKEEKDRSRIRVEEMSTLRGMLDHFLVVGKLVKT